MSGITKKIKSVNTYLPVKMNKKTFVFAMEFDIGEFGQDFTPHCSNDFSTIEQARSAIPTNGTRMAYHIDEALLKRAAPEKNFVIIDYWVGVPQTQKAKFNQIASNKDAAKREGKTWQEYHDEKVALIRRAMREHGERVWWDICGEQDAPAWPDRMFKSKAEAYRWIKDCYLTNKPGPLTGGRKMANFPMMRNRWKVDFKKENISIGVALCYDAHYVCEWGARLVWVETGGWNWNNQIEIAFVRGAGRQYNAYWGVDDSPWGEPAFGTSHFNKKGFRKAGLSESLHLREWIAEFYSGANLVLAEQSAACAWIDMGRGKLKLSPYGENAKKFGKHTLIQHPDRGEPYVPVALMLEHNHGWDPRTHRIWGGRVPHGRAEQMINNFFNMAFPSHEEGFWVSKWMEDGSPQFPWHEADSAGRSPSGCKPQVCVPYNPILRNERDRLRKMLAKGFDSRPYEQGMMVNSRWGDSFDVVLENCPLEVLCKYKLIILLGAVQLTDALEKKLRKYVEQGGELLVNTSQVSKRNEQFLGVKLTGKLHQVCFFHPSWRNRVYMNEIADIEPFEIKAKGVEIMEKTNPDIPSMIRRKLGKGRLYFSAAPYMQNGDSLPFAEHNKDFLDWLISQHLLIKARPGIQYLVNTKGASINVILINNFKDNWSGEIIPVKSGLKLRKGTDLWNNKPLPASVFKKGILKTTCPAFSFRVLSLNN